MINNVAIIDIKLSSWKKPHEKMFNFGCKYAILFTTI